jgi:hypothetical protein
MPTKSKKSKPQNFKQKLAALSQAVREQDTKLFGELSQSFESDVLTDAQKSQVRQVRAQFSKADRRFVKENMQRAEADKVDAGKTFADKQIEKVVELMAQVEQAATKYFEINNTDEVGIEQILANYETLSKLLKIAIQNLPGPSRNEGTLRDDYAGKVQGLNEQMIAHKQELAIKEQLKVIADKAEIQVKNMTPLQMIGFLAPNIPQQEIRKFLRSEEMLDILKQTGDKALGFTEQPVNKGEIVLFSSLPPEAQMALIQAGLALGATQKNNEENSLIQQVVDSLVKNAEDIQLGKKTHLSIVTNVKGNIEVLHIPLEQLLTNPYMITETLYQLVRRGVTNIDSVLTLSSPEQIPALSTLVGVKMAALKEGSLSAFTQKALECSNNPKALTELTGRPVTSGALSLADTGTIPPKGIKIADIFNLAAKIIAIQVALPMVNDALADKQGPLRQLAVDAGHKVLESSGLQALTSAQLGILFEMTRSIVRGKVTLDSLTHQQSTQFKALANLTTDAFIQLMKKVPQIDVTLTTDRISAEQILSAINTKLITAPEPVVAPTIDEPAKVDEQAKVNEPAKADELAANAKFEADKINTKNKEEVAALIKISENRIAAVDKIVQDRSDALASLIKVLTPEFTKIKDLLAKVESLAHKLSEKSKKDSSYIMVSMTASALLVKLNQNADTFFENPSPITLAKFQENTKAAFKDAEFDFGVHRGNAIVNALYTLGQALIALLALITVIPTVQAVRSEKGYKSTFFSHDTDSSKKLAAIKDEFMEQDKKIEDKIKSKDDKGEEYSDVQETPSPK